LEIKFEPKGEKDRKERLLACIDMATSFFEKELAGKEGLLKQEGDVSGAWIFGGNREMLAAQDGDSLILTIDKNIQYKAEEILKERGWLENFDLVSLAKSRDREGIDPLNPQNRERVFKMNQKNPILLKENSAEELLLQFIRDEAHRFAITYHRLRKDRAISTSVLNEVEGMTERMKLKLLRRFGSIDGLREASDDEILQEVNSKMLQRLRERLDEVYDFQGQ
jgi:excinuclease ABC subunit C